MTQLSLVHQASLFLYFLLTMESQNHYDVRPKSQEIVQLLSCSPICIYLHSPGSGMLFKLHDLPAWERVCVTECEIETRNRYLVFGTSDPALGCRLVAASIDR